VDPFPIHSPVARGDLVPMAHGPRLACMGSRRSSPDRRLVRWSIFLAESWTLRGEPAGPMT
jgi:hypothetical protein